MHARMVAMLGFALGVGVQAPAGVQPTILRELAACRALREDAARLACQDRELARLLELVDKREVVLLDRQDVRRTRRSLFGFSLPKLPLFGGGEGRANDAAEEVKEVTATVTRAGSLGNGRFHVTLDNGAVWRTTEPARFEPRAGMTVTLKRAALGGYFMSYGSSGGVRAMRIN